MESHGEDPLSADTAVATADEDAGSAGVSQEATGATGEASAEAAGSASPSAASAAIEHRA